jgi:mannose-6-phosphate isomerase
LHIEKALEAIDFKMYPAYKTPYGQIPNRPNMLAACNYFTVNYLELTQAVERDYVAVDAFVIYMCIEGSFTIRYYDTEHETVIKGDTVLLPAELKNVQLIPDKTAKILEIYIEGLIPQDRSAELLNNIL